VSPRSDRRFHQRTGAFGGKCSSSLSAPARAPGLASSADSKLESRFFRESYEIKLGRAASGGALAPEPPRATGVGPEFRQIFVSVLHFVYGCRALSCLFSRFF